MSAHSSIDSLRRLSPVSDTDASAVFGSAGREELLVAVTRLPLGRGVRARFLPRRRRRLVLALAVLAVLGATAATWAVVRAPARETTSVQCLIDGNDAIVPSVSGDPAADCALEWQRDQGTTPPPLVAYDNGLGGVTVIPRGQKPQAGWTRLPGQSQDVALIELQYSLDDAINGLNSSCLDPTAATRLTQAKLAQFGFSSWTVTVRDPSSANTPGNCVSAEVLDPVTTTVTLIAMGTTSAGGSARELADKLRPLTQECQSLPDAVAAVRATAAGLGMAESARTYDLNAVTDDSMRCASITETVGGTIFLTVRGPER